MPRKKNVCGLPRPRRLDGRRHELTQNKVLAAVRSLALVHQQDEPQLFYPLRDIARQMGAPLSLVAKAYAALKKEGILGTVRASRTVIEGRRFISKIGFKGFIGLPVSLSCFTTLTDCRLFYLTLRREFRRRGFVSNILFFSDGVAEHEALLQTVEEFGIHRLVWYLPRPSAEEVILSLNDKGIRVIGVADSEAAAIPCEYEIRRTRGLTEILRRWRTRRGISTVTIVRSRVVAADNGTFEAAALKAGIHYEFAEINEQPIATLISQLAGRRKHGVILPAACATIFSLRAPASFTQLLQTCRVTLPDGLVTTLDSHDLRGSADVLLVDWPAVARTIVDDLTAKNFPALSSHTVFEASAQFDLPLGSFTKAG